jgi:ABC-type branched-subunit amino acid transport system substrate-binding protein
LTAFAAEPIKIGSVLSVTGPAAFLGDPELKTLQMYVEDINKKGGVLGRQSGTGALRRRQRRQQGQRLRQAPD